MFILLLAVAIVLLSSALCSGTEAALFSIPLMKARQLAQSRRPAALALLSIRERVSRPIATVVVLNNIANIVGSIMVGGIASRVLGSRWLGVFSGVLTLLVIVLAEIIPKTLGERYAEPISLTVARPLAALTWLVTPLLWGLEKLTYPWTHGVPTTTTSEAEIKLLARIGHHEGVIEQDELEMIQRIFQLNDKKAAELMTPRVMLTALPGQQPLGEAKAEILDSPHSRILVTEENVDHVTGVVFKDELLQALITGDTSRPVATWQHPVHFVPETVLADSLLSVFRRTRQHLAVVVDEYGGVAGVVTLEDVLEVLTGAIVDETDEFADLRAAARQHREELLRASRELPTSETGEHR